MLTVFERLAARRTRRLIVVAVAVAVGTLGASAGPALAATPTSWHVTMEQRNPYGLQEEKCPTKKAEPSVPCGVDPYTHSATSFARESGLNTYTIKVENTGETTSAGTVTVVDKLPEGLVFAGSAATVPASGTGWTCKLNSNATSTECTTAAALAKGLSFSPIILRVHVAPQAKNPSLNTATVSGGGGEPASATDETEVTEPVPFGIASFSASEVDEKSLPFNQAGGHPFAYQTEIVFNYTTADNGGNPAEGQLVPAGGAAKETYAELAPGFVGNTQNTPLCPLGLLKGNRCPANTAIGYVHVTLAGGGGKILNGKARPVEVPSAPGISSLVYNLQPAPGQPADLGFVVAGGLPFVLEAKLRSDGDYGITVGDGAGGNTPKLLAVQLITCENGAAGTSPNFSCNAAPANSKAFFQNPTQCTSSPPMTSVRADSWNEPAVYVSKAVPMGANLVGGEPNAESFLTGCDLLQFHPELEFKPSPASEGGTTQADEPTGIAVNLKLPQTDEADLNATPELRNVVMTLPAGLTASASAADGLQACSNAQFGPGTEFGPGSEHSEPARPASCPLASRIGTVEVFTPLLSGAPSIEGVPETGHELTCSPGKWSASPELSYQWLRNGVPIEGAAGREDNEYAPVSEDVGKAVQCQVTATNGAGSAVAVSRDVVVFINVEPSPTAPFPPSSVAAPTGTPTAGNPLTCAAGAWTGSPTFTYKWLRGGQEIPSANGETYTLTSEDEGKAIQCQVIGKNTVGTVIADSAAVVASPAPSTALPLPGAALQGQAFLGEPECSPCTNEDAQDGKLLRIFLQIQEPRDGVIVKLHGTTSANPVTGQLTTTFLEQPQQPFELLQLRLKGGPGAPLANSQTCGPATTTSDLTPWSAPGLGGLSGVEQIAGTPDATPSSTYNVDFDGAGGACPSVFPFSPSFNAGTIGANATAAGLSPSFSLTIHRNDREQDLSGVDVHMPLGLVGKIAGIPRCGEAAANAGTCGPESQIGTADAGAGPGPHPFFDTGRVYLTGPYKGGPFGLSIVTPAVAGPFNLGNVIVRSAIYIDPHTAAVTVNSDPLPQIIDGVPLRLREVNVNVDRPGFMLNPTNCAAQQVSTTLSSAQGATANVASPFGIKGCTSLPFKPTFTATTQAHTSKTEGASLDVKITYPPGAYANVGKSVTFLPEALPSRLTTIQKACPDTTFEANPATCPEGSVIGTGTAHTPLLASALTGPAYLVSHGNRAFPDLEIILQAEGVMVVLDGATDIKKGVTKTTFEAVPDSPISTFELNLPEGPHSALAAPASLCTKPLYLPTTLTGQNGAVFNQNTQIAVIGCAPTVSITKAKLAGNALMVTLTTSTKGTVKISGKGLKTVRKTLNPGKYQIRVAFTKAGKSLRKHHKKTSLRVSLSVVGKPAVAKSSTVRL